jgi:hypothetical protein
VKCGKYSLANFVLRAEIAAAFGPNVVAISRARNTKVYKICKLCKAIFSAFYNISQPNFAINHFCTLFLLAVVIYLHLLA